MAENWRLVPGSHNVKASDMGRIMVDGICVKTSAKGGNGYLRLTSHVMVNGKRERYVHRLVAMTYCEHPEGRDRVNHKNGKKHDNRARNLEWSTNRENLLLARDKFGKGARHKTPIRLTNIQTGEIRIYPSQREASRGIHCNDSEINKMLHGHRKSCHGWICEYLSPEDAMNALDKETGQLSFHFKEDNT